MAERKSRTSRTSTELDAQPNVKEVHIHTFSPITKHFFVSLIAVVHVAEDAPISWHRAQEAFIPKGATAERCIMVMCSLVRSWYRGLWDKKTEKETKNQTGWKQTRPASLGHMDVWTDDEERERSLCNRDASGTQRSE